MKKVNFGSNHTSTGKKEPFWKPWGMAGWLLRLLGFLLLLFTLILLLNLFKSCGDDRLADNDSVIPSPIIHPDTPEPVRVPVDTSTPVQHNIPNPGPNLPSPDHNFIPPHNDDDVDTQDGRQIVGDRLNVILDSPNTDDSTFRQWADEFKALYPGDEYSIVYYDNLTKLMQIQVPQSELQQVMENLPRQITDISFKVFYEGLIQFRGSYHPNDPAFRYPEFTWHFAPIQAYEAWDITKGSSDVVLAIVDSYFDLNHEELNSNRIVKPYCIERGTGDVSPDQCDEVPFNHGTLVACTALGNMDNGRGTTGIAPGCQFMPVSLGKAPTSIAVMQGLLYAIYQGADVVNLSLGFVPAEFSNLSVDAQIAMSRQLGLIDQDVWDYVMGLANDRNVTVVWAAGNEDAYLAIDPSKRGSASIKVSAVDTDLHQSDFTNFGNFPEYNLSESTISAPGVNIFGACPFNTYLPLEWGTGTSFAAPIVAGAVALMKSLDQTLTTAEITEILQETGKPVEGAPSIGKLIQIKDALLRVKENFANFDDVMANHDLLRGLWQSTQLLDIYEGDQHIDALCRMYFDMPSSSNGTVIYYTTDTRLDYSAAITVEWQADRFIMTQAALATHPTNGVHNFEQATFTCKPDDNRLLKCDYRTQSGATNSYYLRRVRQRAD